MKGKPPKIDIMQLYAKSDSKEWNNFLASCLARNDMKSLEYVLYGIQLGMSDAAKKKLNTEKIDVFFLRLQRSIENTMKQIIRAKEPHPLDNAFNHEEFAKTIGAKRARDRGLEEHLRKVRY